MGGRDWLIDVWAIAASLSDIMRRFKNLDKSISEFPDYVAIQLNDVRFSFPLFPRFIPIPS